jgi:hypothetical protein
MTGVERSGGGGGEDVFSGVEISGGAAPLRFFLLFFNCGSRNVEGVAICWAGGTMTGEEAGGEDVFSGSSLGTMTGVEISGGGGGEDVFSGVEISGGGCR